MIEEQVSKCWELYRAGKEYVARLGLNETVKENVDFYEGRQWAAPTRTTRNMPRPVVNMVKFVCRNKRAKLTLTPVKLLFRCENNAALGEKFGEFAAYLMKEMRLKELDSRAIKDALVKGSYCYHFYWDDSCMDTLGVDKGAVRCELVDPLQVFFANPLECDEQKQDWVMIATRMPVDKALALADEDADKSLIVPDETDGETEQHGSKLCTVLTRYFRVDDEVFCERAVKCTMLNKARPLSPDVTWKKENGEVVEYNKQKAKLYPLVFGCYEERDKSIYGISEVEGIVPNQKIINHILGMEALAIQNVAWGKYVVSKDALRGQQISNEPGEVLVDHSATGNGIRKLEHPSLASTPLHFVDSLANLTRVVTGSSEVMTGEQLNNMSGTAIAALQAQANQPIEEQRERFWRVKERQGKVLAQCCRLYYDKKLWYMEQDDGQTELKLFDAEEYRDIELAVTVQACTGTSSTTASDISLLETLFAKGAIDAVTFVDAYPEEALCDKTNILQKVAACASNAVALDEVGVNEPRQ